MGVLSEYWETYPMRINKMLENTLMRDPPRKHHYSTDKKRWNPQWMEVEPQLVVKCFWSALYYILIKGEFY